MEKKIIDKKDLEILYNLFFLNIWAINFVCKYNSYSWKILLFRARHDLFIYFSVFIHILGIKY